VTITTKYPLVAGSKIRTGVLLLPARASHLQKHRAKSNFIYTYIYIFFFIRYMRGGKENNITTVGEIIKEHGIFFYFIVDLTLERATGHTAQTHSHTCLTKPVFTPKTIDGGSWKKLITNAGILEQGQWVGQKAGDRLWFFNQSAGKHKTCGSWLRTNN